MICGLRCGWACRKQARIRLQKPNLDNTRKLRGIYSIDPEDGESQETENARNKLDVPIEAAMLLKMVRTQRARKPQETVASGSTEPYKNTKYACIVEAHESIRKRFQITLPRNPELVRFLCCCHVLSCFGSFGHSSECCTLAGRPDSSRIISSHLITGRSYSFKWRRERRNHRFH